MNQKTQYQPLTIKYGPKAFANLMGHDVLVCMLSSAIINERIASTYLFTGLRGVAKTTSARIVATAINCVNPKVNGTEVEACGECSNCKAVKAGNHPDIIEFDVASRTSVDNVRQIIESSEYKYFLGKYKIFIINQVHMISKNAFNALLQTLELPPKNVLFIFATTEVNKIQITILSHCQRFDLRRLSPEEIDALLTKISEAAEIKFEKEAIDLIAAMPESSARDAISMLDRASLFASAHNNGTVSLDLTREILAITSLDLVIEFIENILNQNIEKALGNISQVNSNSGDILYFLENMLDVIGYRTKLASTENYSESLYSKYSEKLSKISSNYSVTIFTMIWQIFSKSIPEIKRSHNQFLSPKLAAIKAICAAKLPTLLEIAENVKENPGQSLQDA